MLKAENADGFVVLSERMLAAWSSRDLGTEVKPFVASTQGEDRRLGIEGADPFGRRGKSRPVRGRGAGGRASPGS